MQISVIVPIYNIEMYLRETLQSIAAQKGVSFEVLMIDDGSTDRSGEIAAEFARRDRRFRYLPRKNRGVSAARNTGIDLAAGEYIAFCDGDDLLPGGSLKALYRTARKKEADLVIGAMYQSGSAAAVLYKATGRLGKKETVSKADTDLLWTFMISGKLYRRQFLLEHRIRFPALKYSEDAVFFMNCVYTADVICGCSHPAYYYRKRSVMQESSVTQRCSRDLWEDFIEAHRQVEALYRHYLKAQLPEKQQRIYENAIYRKTAESILAAFYRRYWSCPAELSEEILDSFHSYLEKMGQKSRKKLLEDNRDLFPDTKGAPGNFADEPLITVLIPEGIFKGGQQEAAEKLPFMLKAIYSQELVAFQVAADDVYETCIPEVFRNMPNFHLKKPRDGVSSEYILVLDKPVIPAPDALLNGWKYLNSHADKSCVASCSPGKRYGKLPMKLCANPRFNFAVRLWCKVQAKLPVLFENRSVQICRTADFCPDGKRTGAGKKGISGESGFRILSI